MCVSGYRRACVRVCVPASVRACVRVSVRPSVRLYRIVLIVRYIREPPNSEFPRVHCTYRIVLNRRSAGLSQCRIDNDANSTLIQCCFPPPSLPPTTPHHPPPPRTHPTYTHNKERLVGTSSPKYRCFR